MLAGYRNCPALLLSLLLLTPAMRADPPHDSSGDDDVDLLDFASLQRHNGYDPNDPNDPILAVHDFDSDGLSNGHISTEDFLGYCSLLYGVGIASSSPDEPETPSCDPVQPVEESDDPNDDEYWPPCPPAGDPSTPDDVGDGLYLRLTTGNVWTTVPVFRSYAGGATDLRFDLRYDSIRAHEERPVGYGWTHNYQMYLNVIAEFSGEPTKIIYRDGTGRRNYFYYTGANDSWVSPKGRAYTLTYETDHFVLLYPNGTQLVFEPIVDQIGRIAQVVDRRGRTTRFEYDVDGQLIQVTSPYGRVATFEYQNGHMWRINHPDGEHTLLTYYGSYLTRVTDPQSNYVAYEYQGGRLAREQLKNGRVYTAEYPSNRKRVIRDENGAIVAQVTSPLWAPFPDRRSNTIEPATVIYRDGRPGTYYWYVRRDNLGRLRGAKRLGGPEWLRVYGDHGSGANRNRVVRIVNEKGDARQFTWSGNGRITKYTDEAGHVTDYEYSEPNFSTLVTKRIEPGTAPNRDEWVYEYDDTNGDLLTVADPRDESEYDPEADDAVVTYSYTDYGAREALSDPTLPDLPGRIKEITKTDRNGNVSLAEFNGVGNLTRITRAVGSLDITTEYAYDSVGRRTHKYVQRGVSDVVETEWQYDNMGRLTHMIRDPGGEAITAVYSYDEEGYLETITNPRGYVTQYDYDHRNRLERKTAAVGELDLVTEWVLDGNGNVTQVTDPEGNDTALYYDTRNFLYHVEDSEGYDTWLERDEVGNVTKLTRGIDVAGTELYEVEYEYDEIGRPITKTVDPGEDPEDLNVTTSYEYTDPTGCSGCNGATPGSSLPRKIVDPEGKLIYFHYDELDRRTMVVRKVGTDTLDETPDPNDAVTYYEYDPVGNLTAIVGPEGSRVEFEYDEVNRRSILRGEDSVHGDVQVTLAYDGASNIVNAVLPNGNTVVFTYDDVNRL